MKIKYSMQVNEKQLNMLLKAIDELREKNPDINIDVDYQKLQKEIAPWERYVKNLNRSST